MKQLFFLISFTFLFSNTIFSQNTDEEKKSNRLTKIEAGYMFGGTPSYHYLAAYNGATIGLFHGAKLTDRFHFFGGVNFEKLNDRSLLPIMLDGDFYNKKGNQLFNFKMGYTLAWATKTELETNYNYKGGIQYSFGYGFNLAAKNDWKLKFLISYNFRDTKLVYRIEGVNNAYEDSSKTHLFSLKTVFSF